MGYVLIVSLRVCSSLTDYTEQFSQTWAIYCLVEAQTTVQTAYLQILSFVSTMFFFFSFTSIDNLALSLRKFVGHGDHKKHHDQVNPTSYE